MPARTGRPHRASLHGHERPRGAGHIGPSYSDVRWRSSMNLTRRQFITITATASGIAATGRATLAQQKRVRTIAGTGTAGSQQDPADAAAQALVNNPYGVVIGPDG